MPSTTPISTQARLMMPFRSVSPRVKNDIQPTNMVHTGISNARMLSVAAEEAMMESPITTLAWVENVLLVMNVLLLIGFVLTYRFCNRYWFRNKHRLRNRHRSACCSCEATIGT